MTWYEWGVEQDISSPKIVSPWKAIIGQVTNLRYLTMTNGLHFGYAPPPQGYN